MIIPRKWAAPAAGILLLILVCLLFSESSRGHRPQSLLPYAGGDITVTAATVSPDAPKAPPGPRDTVSVVPPESSTDDPPEASEPSAAPEWPYPLPLPRIVNQDNPLPETYVPPLEKLFTYYQATPETCAAIHALLEASREEGIRGLYVRSAYRSYETQATLHRDKVEQYRGQYGEDAERIASRIVLPAGCSEHQLGETLDVCTSTLRQSFGETRAGRWLRDNAHRFGFILRYPKDKEDVTGVIYEPWHIRYLGEETARILYDLGLTLEEYAALYETYAVAQ